MKTFLRKASIVMAMVALTGCPKDEEADDDAKAENDEDEDEKPSKKKKAKDEPKEEPTTEPTLDLAPTAPTATSRAKAELDNREPDAGFTGSTLGVTGAKVVFTTPTGWTSKKEGDVQTAVATDGKARFGATNLADTETASAKANTVASTLTLTECTWNPEESVTLGKDKIAATVADGVCKREGNTARAIYANVPSASGPVISVGAWDDPGGDANAVFNTFRSAKNLTGGGGGGGIAACCAAIQGNMQSAPPQHLPAYQAALGLCNSLKSNPQGAAALGQVRGLLASVGVPAGCQ